MASGPGAWGDRLVLIVATILSGNALGSLGVADDSLVALAFYIALRTWGFLTTIFAVAVLCEMYRNTRPEPRIPQGPGMADQTLA